MFVAMLPPYSPALPDRPLAFVILVDRCVGRNFPSADSGLSSEDSALQDCPTRHAGFGQANMTVPLKLDQLAKMV
jgi:hypothetical protein